MIENACLHPSSNQLCQHSVDERLALFGVNGSDYTTILRNMQIQSLLLFSLLIFKYSNLINQIKSAVTCLILVSFLQRFNEENFSRCIAFKFAGIVLPTRIHCVGFWLFKQRQGCVVRKSILQLLDFGFNLSVWHLGKCVLQYPCLTKTVRMDLVSRN